MIFFFLPRGQIIWPHTRLILTLLNTPSAKPVEFKVSTLHAPTPMATVWPANGRHKAVTPLSCVVNLFHQPAVFTPNSAVFTPNKPTQVCSLMSYIYCIFRKQKCDVHNGWYHPWLLIFCITEPVKFVHMHINELSFVAAVLSPGVAPHCLDAGTVQTVTVEKFCGEKWEETMQTHKSIRDMSKPAADAQLRETK